MLFAPVCSCSSHRCALNGCFFRWAACRVRRDRIALRSGTLAEQRQCVTTSVHVAWGLGAIRGVVLGCAADSSLPRRVRKTMKTSAFRVRYNVAAIVLGASLTGGLGACGEADNGDNNDAFFDVDVDGADVGVDGADDTSADV